MSLPYSLIELESPPYAFDTPCSYPYVCRSNQRILLKLRSNWIFHYCPKLILGGYQLGSFTYDPQSPKTTQLTQSIHGHSQEQQFTIISGFLNADGQCEFQLAKPTQSLPIGLFYFRVLWLKDTWSEIQPQQISKTQLGQLITDKACCLSPLNSILVEDCNINLQSLKLQTVFQRCIGGANKVTADHAYNQNVAQFLLKETQLGYNCFHLAPIQELGSSRSYYSIAEQLKLDQSIWGPHSSQFTQLANTFELVKAKHPKTYFIIDIVLNHTSVNSNWILADIRSLYTTETTPELTSALLVDEEIFQWGQSMKGYFLANQSPQHLGVLQKGLDELRQRLIKLELHQYMMPGQATRDLLISLKSPTKSTFMLFQDLPHVALVRFLKSAKFSYRAEPNSASLLPESVLKWQQLELSYEAKDLDRAFSELRQSIEKTFSEIYIPRIIEKVRGQVEYCYLSHKQREFESYQPLVSRYFTQLTLHDGRSVYAANNGWVHKAKGDFAVSPNWYYLLREVNVWTDLLRVRYGSCFDDAPLSWSHMQSYVTLMAQHFDGFRLDNLHGSPVQVVQHLMAAAREVKPSLIIFAELFCDEQGKKLYSQKIGIHSCLEETQHNLSAQRFSNLFYKKISQSRHIGSISGEFVTAGGVTYSCCQQRAPIPLVYDLTHDNSSYYEKGKLVVQAPAAYLTAMCPTFSGSTKGFDLFFKNKIDVTEMKQLYKVELKPPQVISSDLGRVKIISAQPGQIKGSWNEWTPQPLAYHEASKKYFLDVELPIGNYEYVFCPQTTAMTQNAVQAQTIPQVLKLRVRGSASYQKVLYHSLNEMRKEANQNSEIFAEYNESYLTSMNQIVMLYRSHSDLEESFLVIANLSCDPQPLTTDIWLEGYHQQASIWVQVSTHEKDPLGLLGNTKQNSVSAQSVVVHSRRLQQFFQVQTDHEGSKQKLIGTQIPPGFVCLITCKKVNRDIAILREVRSALNKKIQLDPIDAFQANLLLFGSEKEEQLRYGHSNYVLPQQNMKQLVYGGLAAISKAICIIKRTNNLSHGLLANIREGRWILDFFLGRLKGHKSLQKVYRQMEGFFETLSQLPPNIRPKYFVAYIYKLTNCLSQQIRDTQLAEISKFNPTQSVLKDKQSVQLSSSLCLRLRVALTQFIARMSRNSPQFQVSISAGLPHFATGWARSWGRDTFISVTSLLQYPRILKEVIKQYASVSRHGLIPNLLDAGNNPRYNSRDACWWWIRAVHEYVRATGDYLILQEKIKMVFHCDSYDQHQKRKHQGDPQPQISLEAVIHNIFQKHVDGIQFREWRAGFQIDDKMQSEGFNISLKADKATGFIMGGNQFNCLTWMDKMGSSRKAFNYGVPATPRAGAPVEMVGLLKSCISAYSQLHAQGHYSYEFITLNGNKIKLAEWAELIQVNFESCFYIPSSGEQSKIGGIYRDVYAPCVQGEDIRLRPNCLIAMAVAPELFSDKQALNYLENVENYLLQDKSIGVSTLAPIHTSLYNSQYNNDDNSQDAIVAHGFNYHNGPEWVWLYGFYICAKLKFTPQPQRKGKRWLSLLHRHLEILQSTQWQSLPQLTNSNGQENSFSCSAQSWSVSGCLMALQAIRRLIE